MQLFSIIDSEAALKLAAQGMFTGLGSALGSYLAVNYGIHKIEKLLKRRGIKWRSSPSPRARTR